MPTAFLDACCLVSLLKRELCLAVAEAGLCRLVWSRQVLDEAEWATARVLSMREGFAPEEAAARAAALRRALEAAYPSAMVPDEMISLEGGPKVRDPDDRHVVSGAMAAKAALIVTENLRDFPRRKLAAVGLGVMSTDAFLASLFDAEPQKMAKAVDAVRQRLDGGVLRNPYPVALAQAGLRLLAKRIG